MIEGAVAGGIKNFDDLLDRAMLVEPLVSNVPLTAISVGRTVAALAEHAPNVTGQTLYVDNGFSITG